MFAYQLLARLRYLTLTAGTFYDDDLFIGTEDYWKMVTDEERRYEMDSVSNK